MKVNVEVDCTPEEARAFLGLPDVSVLHTAYLDRMKALMKDGVKPGDVEALMKSWMPMGLEQIQQAMWGALGSAAGKATGKKK